MLQRLANPYLLLTLAALFWSSNMVIGRAIRGDIPPFTLAFGRWVVAGLIVLPLALPQVTAQWPQLKAGWRPLLILGLLGIAGYNTIALAWRPAGLHSMLMLGATIGIGIAALAPACAWELAHGARPNVSPGTLATVAYLGIVPGVLSYIFYNRGVVEVGANRASLFIHLMPVFGTLLSSLFLGEVAQAYHYLGIALIFGGIGLTMAR